jgi:hypothetical protein
LSVTAEIVPVEVPPVLENTTVAPPVEIKLLLVSRAVNVTVTAEPEATLAEETVIKELTAEIVPGFTVTVGKLEVSGDEFRVARRVVAVPETIPVKVAV